MRTAEVLDTYGEPRSRTGRGPRGNCVGAVWLALVALGSAAIIGGCGGKGNIDIPPPTSDLKVRGELQVPFDEVKKALILDTETSERDKQALWEEKYKGYKVTWEGTVVAVAPRSIRVAHNKEFKPDVTIRYEPGEPPPPSNISEYDTIKYRGVLEGFNELLGFTVVKAEILEHKPRKK